MSQAAYPKTNLARRKERWFYLLISPWLIGFFCFQFVPLLGSSLLAFFEWPFPNPAYFVGLEHLSALLKDDLFGRTLLNTLYYAAGTVPFGIGLGLGLALLLKNRFPGSGVLRALFFLPVVISGVATTLLWGWIFNPHYGLINGMLELVGITGPAWFYDPQWAMPALILMNLWNVGINLVVYLAALQAIPAELYEAAALDGASRWTLIRYITWPLVSPATFYLVVVNLLAAFQVFTPSYILTRGGPEHATLTLPLYIYLNIFSYGKFGYGAALATTTLLIILTMTLLQFRLAKRWVFYLGTEN